MLPASLQLVLLVAAMIQLRSLYQKQRWDLLLPFVGLFAATALAQALLAAKKRRAMSEAAEAWAAADRPAIETVAPAVANRECPAPRACMVTGGKGMVGKRVIEMLLERGAERVVCLDIDPTPEAEHHPSGKVEYIAGDIKDLPTVVRACKDVDVVFHIAALVGPFFSHAAVRTPPHPDSPSPPSPA